MTFLSNNHAELSFLLRESFLLEKVFKQDPRRPYPLQNLNKEL